MAVSAREGGTETREGVGVRWGARVRAGIRQEKVFPDSVWVSDRGGVRVLGGVEEGRCPRPGKVLNCGFGVRVSVLRGRVGQGQVSSDSERAFDGDSGLDTRDSPGLPRGNGQGSGSRDILAAPNRDGSFEPVLVGKAVQGEDVRALPRAEMKEGV